MVHTEDSNNNKSCKIILLANNLGLPILSILPAMEPDFKNLDPDPVQDIIIKKSLCFFSFIFL